MDLGKAHKMLMKEAIEDFGNPKSPYLSVSEALLVIRKYRNGLMRDIHDELLKEMREADTQYRISKNKWKSIWNFTLSK